MTRDQGRGAGSTRPRTKDNAPPTPQHNVSHFCVFCVSCAMVLLENTLRHDAKIGSASRLRFGCARAGELAGGAHPAAESAPP